MTPPFAYPTEPVERRHGPRGYDRAQSYRPWLRDEFGFRCVFCLIRERWVQRHLEVDHFEPTSRVPEVALKYENLLYVCRSCNEAKADKIVPDPCLHLLQGAITLEANGVLNAKTPQAHKIVQVLGLNTKRFRFYRRLWLQIIRLAEKEDATLYYQLMSFPDLLPDLDRLRPPGGNAKPDGISMSHRARRLRGELPDTY